MAAMPAIPAWQVQEGELLQASQKLLESSELSLQELMCSTLDVDYFMQHREEFDNLPEAFILYMLAMPGCKLRLPEYFHLVVKPGRRCIMIPSCPLQGEESSWTTEHMNRIVDLIREQCPPGSLEKFGLSDRPHTKDCRFARSHEVWPFVSARQPDMERVHALLREQPGLQEINMDHFVISQETLSIIGETCHDLRSLSFYRCEEGINLSIMRQLVHGCPHLQSFRFQDWDNWWNIKVEDCAIGQYKLEHWRDLTDASPYTAVNSIVRFSESGGILPPSFRPSVYFREESDFNHVPLISTLCPYVSSLTIVSSRAIGESSLDLTPFKFTSVKDLKIEVLNEDIPNIEPCLKELGSNVVKLSLCQTRQFRPSDISVDLSIVTQHCPKLEEIRIESIPIASTCEYPVTTEKVQFVRCLSTTPLYTLPVQSCLAPDAFLYPIICNGVLEHFVVPSVSPGLLARLSQEARAAVAASRPSPVFPKLRCMCVGRVGQTAMTLQQAVALVSLAPRLRYVYFESLSDGDKIEMRNYLARFAPRAHLES